MPSNGPRHWPAERISANAPHTFRRAAFLVAICRWPQAILSGPPTLAIQLWLREGDSGQEMNSVFPKYSFPVVFLARPYFPSCQPKHSRGPFSPRNECLPAPNNQPVCAGADRSAQLQPVPPSALTKTVAGRNSPTPIPTSPISQFPSPPQFVATAAASRPSASRPVSVFSIFGCCLPAGVSRACAQIWGLFNRICLPSAIPVTSRQSRSTANQQGEFIPSIVHRRPGRAAFLA